MMRKKEQSLLNDAVWPLSHLGCFFFFLFFFGVLSSTGLMRERAKGGEVIG